MIFDWAKKLNDEGYAKALVESENWGTLVPPMPSEQVQKKYVGTSGLNSFKDPSIFISLIKYITKNEGVPLSPHSMILDFGVGWGRFYRWLLRDFDSSQNYWC